MSSEHERWCVLVRGIVQGVGYRPFVYGLATAAGLAGFVRNGSDGVTIEVEGPPAALAAFVASLAAAAPPLARVDGVSYETLAPQGLAGFAIVASQGAARADTLIAPDSATCADCLAELFDPRDRRYRYPFINCTNCGPRFTIVADVPYDRAKTTMAGFALCARCAAEYHDPANRRFHAQPNACPACGPQLSFEWLAAPLTPGPADPLAATVAALLAGQIVALKGLGGYHLACDAGDAAAVARLRRRKQREAKPFALMVADLAAARRLCTVGDDEAALLGSPRRPIVLLDRLPGVELPPDLAPGQPTLGIMLPYTPLHHLLLRDFVAARGPARPAALVLTSGNLSDEPIAYRDEDARARLAPIADAMLSHNRPILTRCDDSVARIVAGGPLLLRRARGYAPEPLRLHMAFAQPVLAYGGHLKNTFCLARGHDAFMSHHIGDLENLETLESLREGIAHFQRLFAIEPEVIAYDLHPEYLATKAALNSPIARKIGVQHHHGHVASVIAEHGLAGPVIGLAADGTGYGADGAIWGGEIMVADLAGYERVGHLAYIALPGGEQAVRQPWRVAAAYLQQIYGPGWLDLELPFAKGIDRARWALLSQMIARRLNSPPCSSMGRLFDAAAALIGLRSEALYEGQAAIELEALAEPDVPAYPFAIQAGRPFLLDVGPTLIALVEDLQRGATASRAAGRFQRAIAELLLAACHAVRASHGLTTVALSGGVFQNRLLLSTLLALLERDGFAAYTNRRVPPNDGGLSLGQAAIAGWVVGGRW
jgi:hydrogenase maturation protein HypF